MTSLHRTYLVFPLKANFFDRKWTFTLKYRQTDRKQLKFIRNGSTHCALRLLFIGKCVHRKGNIKHVRCWSETFSVDSHRKSIIAKRRCSHSAMNRFDHSIMVIDRLPSCCGYTPLKCFTLDMLTIKPQIHIAHHLLVIECQLDI